MQKHKIFPINQPDVLFKVKYSLIPYNLQHEFDTNRRINSPQDSGKVA